MLIASAVYKPWASVAVMFGGSANAVKALRLGLRISRLSGHPLDVFTQPGKRQAADYRQILIDAHLGGDMDRHVRRWEMFEAGDFAVNLFRVPHDALVVLGACGHGVVHEMLFGSVMEKVQSVCPNNLLIVGPRYQAPM